MAESLIQKEIEAIKDFNFLELNEFHAVNLLNYKHLDFNCEICYFMAGNFELNDKVVLIYIYRHLKVESEVGNYLVSINNIYPGNFISFWSQVQSIEDLICYAF